MPSALSPAVAKCWKRGNNSTAEDERIRDREMDRRQACLLEKRTQGQTEAGVGVLHKTRTENLLITIRHQQRLGVQVKILFLIKEGLPLPIKKLLQSRSGMGNNICSTPSLPHATLGCDQCSLSPAKWYQACNTDADRRIFPVTVYI